jgi:hypothetical protein
MLRLALGGEKVEVIRRWTAARDSMTSMALVQKSPNPKAATLLLSSSARKTKFTQGFKVLGRR